MTLHATLQVNARAVPDQPWLRFGDEAWAYAEGDALTDRLAAGLLARGVRPGDRVALLFTNAPELVFCFFACFKIGAVAVPLNTRFQAPELLYAVAHCGARILIGQSDLCAPLVPGAAACPPLEQVFVTGSVLAGTAPFAELERPSQPLPAVEPATLAVLLYTSGTTARPKGVMHSHATLRRQSANYLGVVGKAPYSQTLIFTPLCHIAGFSVLLLPATEAGGTITILPRFEPEAVLRTIDANRITLSGALPVMLNALVSSPRTGDFDLSSLRMFLAGGDCVPIELQTRCKARVGVDVDEVCGMTEVMYSHQPVDRGERRPGTIGKPFGDVHIRLEDANGMEVADGETGEIVVRSGAVTLGYWNDPENTQAALRDGAMHTGDLARRDADGYLWFAGRTKDIIISGGSNVSPGEVEDALYAHPGVYEAGVVGVPCSVLGQRVRAYVALKPGAQTTDRELIDWTATRVAAYKVPETIVFLPVLPKGPTGKVLRKALRDLAV